MISCDSYTHRVFEAAECSQFTDSGFLSLTNVSDCGLNIMLKAQTSILNLFHINVRTTLNCIQKHCNCYFIIILQYTLVYSLSIHCFLTAGLSTAREDGPGGVCYG